MKGLPEGYTARPINLDDTECLSDLVNAYMASNGSEERVSTEQLRGQLSIPGFDAGRASRLVLDPDGDVMGAALVIDVAEPHVNVHGVAVVLREHQGHGIGSALHAWIESVARGAIEKAPAGARVVLQQSVSENETSANAFLQATGYVHVRHFWRMAIELQDAIADPGWPDGFTLETLDPEAEFEPIIEAAIDAFRDHYGHVEGDLDGRLERARHRMKTDPAFDASLYFYARAGEDIAAVCFCSGEFGGDASIGYVNSLGVRRAWRRRGLALALLQHAFGELKRRGKKRAMLHVDAESLTGATRLYEKAGMHVDELSHLYELELRPGIDLATKTAD